MQTRRSSTFALRLVAMLALVGALALLGCPSDDDDAVVIGTRVVALNPSNAAALVGDTPTTDAFTFSGGVPDFGTGGSTVVDFPLPGAGDDFGSGERATITTADNTASAGAEYASCTFTVITSDFPAGSLLAPDADPIEIDPCALTVNAGEFTVGGPSGPCTIRLGFRSTLSQPVDATCSIDVNGNLVVNGTIITGSIGVGD